MAHYELPKRRRIYLMRHGDVTYFDDTGRAIDPKRAARTRGNRAKHGAGSVARMAGNSRRQLKSISMADVERAVLSVFDGVVPKDTRFLGGETIGELLDRASA